MFMFLLGSFVRSSSQLHFWVHGDSSLRGRVVIGAIVGARDALERLKVRSLHERLFQEGPKTTDIFQEGGDPSAWRVDVYTRKYTLESTTLTRRLPPTGFGGYFRAVPCRAQY